MSVHREVLRRNVVFLKENLYDISEILDHLLAACIISWDEKDEISSQLTKRQRLEALVDVLRTKDNAGFRAFCDALDDCKCEFVADKLRLDEEQLHLEGFTDGPSIESSWFAELSSECRSRQLTPEDLTHLSRQLSPHCFFQVGLLMGFSKGRLEQYQASNSYSVSCQFLNLLSDWSSKEANSATVERLVTIFRAAGINETDYKDAFKTNLPSLVSSLSQKSPVAVQWV